jgi:hypothetical protein
MSTPKKKTPPPRRAPRTRAETAAAFDDVNSSAADREPISAAAKAEKLARATAIREMLQVVTVDDAVKSLTAVGLDIQRTLAGVTSELTAKVTELSTLQEAIEFEKEELERLHGVDVVASSIDDMLAAHTAKEAELEAEAEQKLQDIGRMYAAKQLALKEELEAAQKARAREEDQYLYEVKQTHQKLEDQFSELMRNKQRQAKDTEEALNKNWTAREEALKARETEFKSLSEQVAGFEAKLKSEVDKAVAIATNGLKMTLTHQFALEKKDLEVKNQLVVQETTATKLENTRLLSQVQELQHKLDASTKSVQSIAEKALETSGSNMAFNQVNAATARPDGNSTKARS